MKKLTALIRIALRSIKLGFAPQPPHAWEVSLQQARYEEAERDKRGRQMLGAASEAARGRFNEPVLIKLLGAGWTEGRKADADALEVFQKAAPRAFPRSVMDILSEFGGLDLYACIGRSADIGTVDSEFTARLGTLEKLVGFHLHPIGWTNLFADDGLMICADDSGRIFVDGEAGYKPPLSSRIEYIAASFDRALEVMLDSKRKVDPWPGLPASGMWYYEYPEAPDSGDAAVVELSSDDLSKRLQALIAARPGIEAHVELREKAPSAGTSGNPRATLEQVIDFEKAAGIRLPDDYVFFITMVGYKGSENCWLLTLKDWNAGYWSETKLERDLCAPCLITPELKDLGAQWMDSLGVEDAEMKWDQDEWDPMRGSMTIVEYGCGLYFRMIVNGPHHGRVFIWGEHAMRPPVFGPELTFSDWITHWL